MHPVVRYEDRGQHWKLGRKVLVTANVELVTSAWTSLRRAIAELDMTEMGGVDE